MSKPIRLLGLAVLSLVLAFFASSRVALAGWGDCLDSCDASYQCGGNCNQDCLDACANDCECGNDCDVDYGYEPMGDCDVWPAEMCCLLAT